jgi:flagellar secretion chaperone FliS
MNPQNIGETYRQLGAQGADPLEIVVMLYDVLLDDLRRAIEALHAHDIEKRTAEIQHGLRVLEQLQGSLNMEQGGDPAQNLDKLYAMVRAKLIEAHWKSSEELLRRQIDLLRPVRDAWQEARLQQRPAAKQETAPEMPPPSLDAPALEWRV